MSQLDHLSRKNYGRLTDALDDACRVQRDLLAAIDGDGGLWVDTDRLRFLARRAASLTTAALNVAREEGV